MQDIIYSFYNDIYTSLNKLIPENWQKVYFYASVFEGTESRHSEMYFYYLPKKLIKPKPINCYEIARKFGLDENEYNEALSKLYEKVKKMKWITKENWTNVTIIFDKKLFTIEYHYNNLKNSQYTDEERHLVWCHKYLGLSIDCLNKNNQALVTNYEEESSFSPTIIKENLDKIKNSKIIKHEVRNPILKC